MRYLRLGQTGLRVAELCLGTMTFGAATPPGEARSIFERYVQFGANFLDTAVNYAQGASEEIVGNLIANERDRFVIATKYTAPLRGDDPNSGGNHAKSLRQALECSLRRLKTDYIDLYWVHAWDQTTPSTNSSACSTTRSEPARCSTSGSPTRRHGPSPAPTRWQRRPAEPASRRSRSSTTSPNARPSASCSRWASTSDSAHLHGGHWLAGCSAASTGLQLATAPSPDVCRSTITDSPSATSRSRTR